MSNPFEHPLAALPREPVVGVEHRAGVGHRVTIDGQGAGPWLTEDAASFARQWLALAWPQVQAARVKSWLERMAGERPGPGRDDGPADDRYRVIPGPGPLSIENGGTA